MNEIYFERFDCTFYDADDPILVKKNIETLSNFIEQLGLLALEGEFGKEMRRRRYKSYFMNSLRNLITFLAGEDYDKFFIKRIKLESGLIKRNLYNKEEYQDVDKILKQIFLEFF
ncbi:MAG: hypothetical protein AB1422_14985 [bacterium]